MCLVKRNFAASSLKEFGKLQEGMETTHIQNDPTILTSQPPLRSIAFSSHGCQTMDDHHTITTCYILEGSVECMQQEVAGVLPKHVQNNWHAVGVVITKV